MTPPPAAAAALLGIEHSDKDLYTMFLRKAHWAAFASSVEELGRKICLPHKPSDMLLPSISVKQYGIS